MSESPEPFDEQDLQLPTESRQQVDFVTPTIAKRTFYDGSPSSRLKNVVNRIRDEVAREYYPALNADFYDHPPLEPGQDIRVLNVVKGRPGDKIRCQLIPSALEANPKYQQTVSVIPYVALSYYWGQEAATMPIQIAVIKSNAPKSSITVTWKTFMIRPNLHAALSHLRDTKTNIGLWVDALCIKQDNIVEKTAQVSKMNEIYGRATRVCIWLGTGDEEIDPETNKKPIKISKSFDFMREMLNLRRLDQLIVSEKHVDQWLDFVQLMRNRWFSRRWVIQEIALARAGTVHYGGDTIQWRDFKDAVALFVTKHDQIKLLCSRSRHHTDPDPVGDMRALGANTLVEATSNLFRRSDTGEILERLLGLETLVSTFLPFEASDPRDTIYAVLSIARDTRARPAPAIDSTTAERVLAAPTHNIIPNYGKSLADLFTEFIESCVSNSKSLDIICRNWAPVPKPGEPVLPSWISLISSSAFGEPEAALQGRSNGDSFVGNPSRRHQKQYNASAALTPLAAFGKHIPQEDSTATTDTGRQQSGGSSSHARDPGPPAAGSNSVKAPIYNGIMSVRGIVLDTIDQLSPRAAQGMIFQEALQMGGIPHNEPAIKSVPDTLWRTLVADRGPGGTNAPSWYSRACLECLAHVTQNGDLNTSTLIETPSSSTTMVSFLRRVQQVIWNRKFLKSLGGPEQVENKYFGLAPTTAKEGDLICILFGCSVPVVLRKIGNGTNHHYEFIGESYVHGVMDGEVVLNLNPEHPYNGDEYRTFEIR